MAARMSWEELRDKRAANDEGFAEGYEQARVNFELAQLAYDLRQRAGLTQQELAKRMGTTQSAIARLEGGDTEPTVDLLRRLGDAVGAKLSLRVDERFGGDAMEVRFGDVRDEPVNQ